MRYHILLVGPVTITLFCGCAAKFCNTTGLNPKTATHLLKPLAVVADKVADAGAFVGPVILFWCYDSRCDSVELIASLERDESGNGGDGADTDEAMDDQNPHTTSLIGDAQSNTEPDTFWKFCVPLDEAFEAAFSSEADKARKYWRKRETELRNLFAVSSDLKVGHTVNTLCRLLRRARIISWTPLTKSR